MCHLPKATFIRVLFFLCLSSVQADELSTFKETYAKNSEQILQNYQAKFAELPQIYQKALETLNTRSQAQGDLIKVMAARAEIERFRNTQSLPEKPETNAPPEILTLQSGYVRQHNRLEQEMTSELSTLVTRYLQALERLQADYVRSNQLDKAIVIKAERDATQPVLDGYVKQLAALKESAQPPGTSPSAPQTSRLIEIDSTTKRGVRLGSFGKGLTLVFQYVEGAWRLSSGQPESWPEKSPDDRERIPDLYRCVLCKHENDLFISLALLPGNTAGSPFRYLLKEDGEIWIMCNDGFLGNNHADNRGVVTYRFEVE